VEGTITGSGPLTVKGEVDGKISLTDHLTLAPEARVDADVEAGWVELRGRLRGSVRAHNHLRILPPGRLEGDAVAPKASVELGAVLQGGLLIRSNPVRRPV
jgi:cytoskeletal protein CcmA (bactofilin family)